MKKHEQREKTLQKLRGFSQEYVLRTFVYVFWVLRLQVGQRVVSYDVNQGVWIVGASAKKLDGQLIDKLSNRGDV